MVLLLLLNTQCAHLQTCGTGDDWLGKDKARHVVASAMIGGGVTALAANQTDTGTASAIGLSTALAAGFGKETYDLTVKETCFSWKDMVWNFIGASVGVTIAAQATE